MRCHYIVGITIRCLDRNIIVFSLHIIFHRLAFGFANSVFHFFEYKNRRGKSKTIVGETPTIDLYFYPIKWLFEIRKCVIS